MQDQTDYRQLYDSMLKAFDAVKLGYLIVEILYDEKGKAVDVIFSDVSPATEELIGKNKQELIGKSSKEVFGNVSDEFPTKMEPVLKTGNPALFQIYGAALHKQYDVYAWKLTQNQVAALMIDITERKKAEEEMAKIASFPSLNPNPIVEADFKGKVSYLNPIAKTLFPNIETLGEKHPFLFDWQNVIRDLKSKGSSTSAREIKVGENWYYQQFFLVPNSQCIRIYSFDISERKKAEEELINATNILSKEYDGLSKLQELSSQLVSKENMQALLNDVLDAGIKITHADMGTLQLYEEKKNALQIAAQKGLNQPFLKFFDSVKQDTIAICTAAMKSGIRVIVEDVTKSPILIKTPALEVQLKAGVRAVQSTPLFSRSGRFLGILSTYHRNTNKPDDSDLRLLDLLVRQAADYIERMQNEQKLEDYSKNLEKMVEEKTRQLKDSERLAAIGATAGMVGHDIRNPLQAIISDAFLAKTELESIPESPEKKYAMESLDEIEKNTEYINKIVQDLQDYARPLNPKAEESDLKTIIENLIAKNVFPREVKVNVKVEEKARWILADSYYINRILHNLVTNSVQAMPNGGKLTIGARREADRVVITVQDTGVGIPEEAQGKLFTVMFTTKSKGQGFGLPVVKRMTESLGGKVTFESQEGKGTIFKVSLPAVKST